jgi:hypothetical protein
LVAAETPRVDECQSFQCALQAKNFYTSHGFEQVGIKWETTRDILQVQDLAVSCMHQLSSNSLFNHYHWHLACYHHRDRDRDLAYYHHRDLAFSYASDSDGSAEDL